MSGQPLTKQNLKHTMKVYLFFIIAVTFAFNLKAQTVRYEIVGEIDNDIKPNVQGGLTEGSFIFLEHTSAKRVDTAVVKNNKFIFVGECPFPDVATIFYKGGGNLIFLDSSKYLIKYSLVNPFPNQYGYNVDIQTKSTYHNFGYTLYGKVDKLKAALNNLDLHMLPGEIGTFNEEREAVISGIKKLFSELLNDNISVAEKTYLLVTDPYFSYQKYIKFYTNLPEEIKRSGIGQRFYNKLIITKNN